MLIQPSHPKISTARQCALIGLPRSSYYYQPAGETDYNLTLMRIIDEQYLKTPFFGSRQMTDWLRLNGHPVNRKRIQRLMRIMGLEGTVPGPHTSKPRPENKVYPYLLRGLTLSHSNLVWSADITFVPMPVGFHVSGSDHRLVQPLRACLAVIQHHRYTVLPGSAPPSPVTRPSVYLQYGPVLPVHQYRLYRPAA